MLSRIPAPVVAGGVIAAEAAVLVLLVPPGTAWIGFALAGLLAMAFAVAVLPRCGVGIAHPASASGARTARSAVCIWSGTGCSPLPPPSE